MKTQPTEFIQRGPVIDQNRQNAWRSLTKSWQKFATSEVAPLTAQAPVNRTTTRKLTRDLSSNLKALPRRSIVAIKLTYVSFREAFGILGPPMIVVVVVCICWTLWLIILTIAPNRTANYLMDTGNYDDGQFWLIPEEFTALELTVVAPCMRMFCSRCWSGANITTSRVHLLIGS
ncbi:unnamed protein product [Phytophthora fragariaefolia]|uniref:Unnamed protein product n=1 Tax=Phytophthora fragariaefolia TaxID=1490495 RepID=A0A9W6XTT0_9STRA|nr:unnamed protein product [Phytophthora fragariaefolia]